MPGQALSHFDIHISVASVWDEDGWLGIQIDAEGAQASSSSASATPGQGGVRDYEVVNPGGIFHRPLDPVIDTAGTIDATQAGQVLSFLEGGRGFVMPLGDPRSTAILPTCSPGSTFVYADNGSFIRMEGSGPAQGQISIFTTDDGTSNGYMVGINVWPTEIRFVCPGGGRHWADVTGFWWIDAGSGGTMSLGTQSGVPGFDAAFNVMCDAAVIDAAIIQLGRKGALQRGPVMRGDLFQAQFMVPLLTALQALAEGISAIGASPAVVGAPPAGAAAAIPLIQTAIGALTALMTPVVTPANTWCSSGTTVA